MQKQAVMFDLDGTLLDTLADLGDAMNASLRDMGVPEHSYDFYRQAVGDGARQFAVRSLPESMREDAQIDRTMRVMRDYYADNWHTKTRPYGGIEELLNVLRGRGIQLAVLSNKPDGDLQRCVNHFFAPGTFVLARGVLPDGPVKPDPAEAIGIAEELGIPAPAWLYVGDTNTDMQTAVAAGLFAVGCTWGFRDRDELVSNGADAVIDTPLELLQFL